ncbi:MAG: hypothetical protein JWN08_522 [Frankiales bacterium]|nr:hypothetical protein [Frankiales bacterium]
MPVDPYAVAFQQDPHPVYAALRASAPVAQVADHGFWMVTTMALVREVLRDPETYSNAVHTGRRTAPPPEVADEVAAIRAEGLPYLPALGLNDPPAHTRYRKLVARAFTARSLRWMEPQVVAAAGELAAALPQHGTVDAVASLARPLPIWTISRILGLPDSWRDDVARWSDAATASLGASAMPPERWLQVARDDLDYQQRIVEELGRRREQPADDLLSSLVAPHPEEGALTDVELVWLVRELVVAGNETTTTLVTDLVLRLSERPDEWARLRDDPSRVAAVVEEGLRLASPAQGMFRGSPARPRSPGSTCPRARSSSWPSARRTATRRSSRTRTSSGPDGRTSASTWPSDRASTPAWATSWPGRRPRLCCFVLRGIAHLPVAVHGRASSPPALT